MHPFLLKDKSVAPKLKHTIGKNKNRHEKMLSLAVQV
jgi:hypothetical protein